MSILLASFLSFGLPITSPSKITMVSEPIIVNSSTNSFFRFESISDNTASAFLLDSFSTNFAGSFSFIFSSASLTMTSNEIPVCSRSSFLLGDLDAKINFIFLPFIYFILNDSLSFHDTDSSTHSTLCILRRYSDFLHPYFIFGFFSGTNTLAFFFSAFMLF